MRRATGRPNAGRSRGAPRGPHARRTQTPSRSCRSGRGTWRRWSCRPRPWQVGGWWPGSGDGGAAGGRTIVSHDHRPSLDAELEPAVAAGRDARLTDDVAFRASEEEPRLVDVAALRAERIEEPILRAVGLAGGDDRPARS